MDLKQMEEGLNCNVSKLKDNKLNMDKHNYSTCKQDKYSTVPNNKTNYMGNTVLNDHSNNHTMKMTTNVKFLVAIGNV